MSTRYIKVVRKTGNPELRFVAKKPKGVVYLSYSTNLKRIEEKIYSDVYEKEEEELSKKYEPKEQEIEKKLHALHKELDKLRDEYNDELEDIMNKIVSEFKENNPQYFI